MKKNSYVLLVLASVLSLPSAASAHGHTSFEIHEKVYSFTIGSLNEPIAVDDKTGLDLRVVSVTHDEHVASKKSGVEQEGTPVTGLEATLKVELAAGGKKKTLSIVPTYGAPGSYRAYFIPTVQTTYAYRIFGMIDNVPFDYTWQCNPAGHPQAPEDKTEVEVSPGVTRIEAAGAFGCPVQKADLGFPEPSVSLYEMNQNMTTVVGDASKGVAEARQYGIAGAGIGIVALFVGIGAVKRKNS